MLNAHLPCSLINGRVGLDKYLSGLFVLEHNISDLISPKVHIDSRHVCVELVTIIHIGRALVDVQLLQILPNSISARGEDLGPVQLDSQVREVIILVLELAEIIARLEEALARYKC